MIIFICLVSSKFLFQTLVTISRKKTEVINLAPLCRVAFKNKLFLNIKFSDFFFFYNFKAEVIVRAVNSFPV